MPVKYGDTVTVEYTGTFDDGTVFDTSAKHGAPLTFKVGAGHVLPVFEANVCDMIVGEEKTIVLKPEDAYGVSDHKLIRKSPVEDFPKDVKLTVGKTLAARMNGGKQVPVRIIAVSDKEITFDFNHPLAGKTLHFKLKLLELKPSE